MTESGPAYAPFFSAMGAAAAMVFSGKVSIGLNNKDPC